jgi:two-component system, cell cycle sensor histidine kinase and response regulator CckA
MFMESNSWHTAFRRRLAVAAVLPALLYMAVFFGWSEDILRASAQEVTSVPKTIRAVVLRDFPPTYFQDEKTGQAMGVAVDVLSKIAEREGMQVTFVFGESWAEMIEMIGRGDADIIPGLTPTEEREKSLLFGGLIDTAPLTSFVRSQDASAQIRSGMTVGATRGSVSLRHLQTIPGVQAKVYEGYTTAILDLLTSRIDGLAGNAEAIWYLARSAGLEDRIKTVGEPFGLARHAIAVSRGNAPLLVQLTGALERFVATPEYWDIYLKWHEKPKPYWTPLRIMLTMTALACLIVLAMAAWRYRSLRRLNQALVENLHERERIESALRESESRFKTLAEATFEGIALIDNDKLVDVNDQLAGMLGWERGELIGAMVDALVAPECRDAVQEALSANLLEPYESAIVRKDGTRVHVESRARMMQTGGQQMRLTAIRDITERKQAEEVLRAQEERLRSAMEAAQQGWFDLNVQTGQVIVSPEYARIIGYEPSEYKMSLREWINTIHPEDRNAVLEAYKEWVETADTRTIEYRCQTKAGDWKWIRSTGRIVSFDAENKPLRITGTHADISQIKRVESALRESLGLYRTLVDASPDAISVTDSQGLLTFASPRALEMFGYSPGDDLTGRSVFDWVSPEDRERALNSMGYVLAERVLNDREYTLIKMDGTRFMGEINAAALYSPDGHARGMVLVTRDITERKRAEKELSEKNRQLNETVIQLEQARNMLHLIIESIPVRVFWKDRDSRFLGCNSLFVEDSGLSHPQQLLGKDDFAMKWREQAELYRADDFQVMESGVPKLNIVEPQTTPTGSTRWLNTSKVPLRLPGGEVFGVLGVYEDITGQKQAEEERRRLEDRLQRAEKMEALGTMAGGVAHDLNNVLGIVVGYSELLLKRMDGSDSMRSRVEQIFKGGVRAAAIVEDLLTLTRRGVPCKAVLNLNDIVADCSRSPEFAKIVSDYPKVELKTDLEADLLNTSGSVVHVVKSLMNLVTNAAEAMPNGGVVTIETHNQYLDKPVSGYDEVKEGDYVVLSVSDTGDGIPAADLDRIFEPFYTKKVMGRSGTGLGLAVVWGTVKDHEGYINVESEEGKGSAFTLYFPITREQLPPEEVLRSAAEYMGKGESILIVDDVKEQCGLATAMLTSLNYAVTSVSSGEAAVEYLGDHPVDLVVLDMIMDPGMDGLDTYSKILERNPHQKAIIVSGFAETERVGKAQNLGAGAYVKKPYVLQKLGLAVRDELGRPA